MAEDARWKKYSRRWEKKAKKALEDVKKYTWKKRAENIINFIKK